MKKSSFFVHLAYFVLLNIFISPFNNFKKQINSNISFLSKSIFSSFSKILYFFGEEVATFTIYLFTFSNTLSNRFFIIILISFKYYFFVYYLLFNII